MQKMLKSSFYLTYKNDQPTVIEGKPLGFIDRKQFYLIYHDPIKFVRKLLSHAPKSLVDIADSASSIKNHRLVFSTLGPKHERQIFISQELSHVTSVSRIKDKIVDLELVDLTNRFLYLECRAIG